MEICGCEQSLALQKEVDELKKENIKLEIRICYWAYRCGYAEGRGPIFNKNERHEITEKAIAKIIKKPTSTKDKTNETT